MLNKRVEEELNKQINAEMYSSYLYQSMAAYFESMNLKGFANWMNVQAQEEMTHAMKFYRFINERGGRVKLGAIEAPKTEWAGLIEVFKDTLEHENYITGRINFLTSIAHEEKDYATVNELQWFIGEQVEEEANANELLEQLKFLNGEGHGIFMIDRELKTRVFVDRTQPTAP